TSLPAATSIVVRGARQNNLRSIDVEIPHGSLSVVTGVSGSGKSSLALETVYAEGQRRYVASLSTYAQQFLDRFPRPAVDAIEGLPPAVSIERANPILTRRSTVGTATEVYDYLRLLYARAGILHCPSCGLPIAPHTATEAADRVMAEAGASAWLITFALTVSEALTHDVLVDNLRSLGFIRLLAGGREVHIEEMEEGSDLTRAIPLFVVVDRVRVGSTPRARIVEAIERAYAEGEGEAVIFARGKTAPEHGRSLSREARCEGCRRTFPEPRPTLFSFNSPYGACPECNGFGNLLEYDPARIVPDPARSLAEGALDPWTKPRYTRRRERLRAFTREAGLSWKAPWSDLPQRARDVLLAGGRYEGIRFEGVLPFLESLEAKKYKAYVRFFLRGYQSYRLCPACGGSRLRPEAVSVTVGGISIVDVIRWPLSRLADWLTGMDPDAAPAGVLGPVRRELERRVGLLLAVGLDYLSLDRLTRTLSGGEAQRIAIANALGTPLTGGLYVLDEPSVGLHARDTGRIVDLLRELTSHGNTALVVEHDLDIVRAADHVIELGPGSGAAGGRVVFAGSPQELVDADTVTGKWLRGEAGLAGNRRPTPKGPWLTVRGARANNLSCIDAAIPLGTLTAVTGVSGSGKSTLVHDVLYRALAARLAPAAGGGAREAEAIGAHDAIEGMERVSGVVLVDQSPIGKSPRSNPATYVKAFDAIRNLFAATPAARRRGFTAGHFSFNTAAGRCPECRGDGHERIEMIFLPDVFVKCEACRGRRYRPEVLAVKWRGHSIADALELTIAEALEFFRGEPGVGGGLWVLQAVGLG
ncbi:MAG: excinuclease ABC subunit UvrA, partial [Gemmatimonadetes bacterium]|nr:excinuclease ABC subunit UvrA [Gemmatimonadota bacterium]